MRYSFYCWIALALLYAMFFGASVARAAEGDIDAVAIAGWATLGILSTTGAIHRYRAALDRKDGAA